LLPTRWFTLAALDAALAAETRRSRDRDGTAGIDPEPTLSLRPGNGSSCPFPAIGGRQKPA